MATRRSGVWGKFVTYGGNERPSDRPLPPPVQDNPNWFAGVIVSSAHAIASGVGMILKSLLNDSDSSEEEDASEDDGNNNNHLGGAENKRMIEKLIMQETFSREEYDWLTKALKSRVAVWVEAEEKCLHSGSAGKADGLEYEEAKTWFDDKKMPSNSVKELSHGANILTTTGVERDELELKELTVVNDELLDSSNYARADGTKDLSYEPKMYLNETAEEELFKKIEAELERFHLNMNSSTLEGIITPDGDKYKQWIMESEQMPSPIKFTDYETGSSSDQDSPIARGGLQWVDQPVVINLSGEPLVAYSEAYFS